VATDIGLVVGNSGAPTAGDASVRSRLETVGYTVTYVDDSAAAPAGFDGFVVAASCTAATVAAKYDAVAEPVVTLLFDVWDDNRLATNVGASTAANATYDLEAHEITAGFADPLTVLTGALAQRGVLASALPAGATVFARPGADATRAAGWLVDAGGTLTSGVAPARRVALFLPDTWPTTLTTDGQILVERVFEWAFRTVTITYEDALSRVNITVTGLGNADTALVERSTNLVTWVPVRGGDEAPVSGGVLTLYDYEFITDVVNYYRVTVKRDAIFVGAGTASHGNNASVTPTVPTGSRAGDLLVIFSAIRNFEGRVTTATGYTEIVSFGNIKTMGKTHSGSESNPTINFTAGVANASTSAQVAAFRNVQLPIQSISDSFQGPTQNIAYAAMPVVASHDLILYLGWKQDDWTSVDTLPGDGGVAVEIGEPSTTLGDDQGLVWNAVVQTTTSAVDVPAGSFIVSGGGDAFSRAHVLEISATSLTVTGSITPVIDQVWLKSVGKPFLNRPLDCTTNPSPISREPRHGIFEIIGRSFPVAVTDLRQSREVTIDVVTRTTQEYTELDLILSAGDPMFIQTPAEHPLPTMHVVIGQVSMRRPLLGRPCDDDWRVFTLPLREVAAPGSDVVGSTVTWQGVINTYASWTAVLAGEVDWLDLLTNVGTPADVIVP
jgi:hypothetical protein